MEASTFEYAGKVRGQGRPRARRAGSIVQMYEAKEDKQYKALLKQAYEDAGGIMYGDEVSIAVYIYVSRALPASKSRKGVEPDRYTPDVDNIAKAVLDALKSSAYADDKQVVMLQVIKAPREGTQDYMHVMVKPVNDMEGLI